VTVRIVWLFLLTFPFLTLQGCVVPVVAAGVGTTGVIMANDRRTHEAFIDDQKIEARSSQLIEKQIKGLMHVNVTSFNYKVLITGEVPDESTREEVGKIVSGIDKVLEVTNELLVAENSSLIARSKDSMITSDVKLRFLHWQKFNPEHIKVITEGTTVFLLGIVTHAEADAATEIARTTQGVNQVVRMFEYMD